MRSKGVATGRCGRGARQRSRRACASDGGAAGWRGGDRPTARSRAILAGCASPARPRSPLPVGIPTAVRAEPEAMARSTTLRIASPTTTRIPLLAWLSSPVISTTCAPRTQSGTRACAARPSTSGRWKWPRAAGAGSRHRFATPRTGWSWRSSSSLAGCSRRRMIPPGNPERMKDLRCQEHGCHRHVDLEARQGAMGMQARSSARATRVFPRHAPTRRL